MRWYRRRGTSNETTYSFGSEPGADWQGRIASALGHAVWGPAPARRLPALILAWPEGQLA